ncbi:hypothetical protein AC069_03580 [Gardnerella vaginalis]|uniref:hypothetical protein n=1 Tax=Gardnerella vaginalis TaxID=2702 RepID=UPI000660EEB1|nr:hypothetical protein [Gardnerella vaginalis]KMT46799.1 hypothetical protein AC069_03580 [Gardnerella vaginalis]
MSRQKQKGTAFESAIVEYLKYKLCDETIERRALNGTCDRGDISGVTFCGHRMVLECKNEARMRLADYVREAETEAANDSAFYYAVIHKKHGTGISTLQTVGQQYVTMPLHMLESMIYDANRWYEEAHEKEKETK